MKQQDKSNVRLVIDDFTKRILIISIWRVREESSRKHHSTGWSERVNEVFRYENYRDAQSIDDGTSSEVQRLSGDIVMLNMHSRWAGQCPHTSRRCFEVIRRMATGRRVFTSGGSGVIDGRITPLQLWTQPKRHFISVMDWALSWCVTETFRRIHYLWLTQRKWVRTNDVVEIKPNYYLTTGHCEIADDNLRNSKYKFPPGYSDLDRVTSNDTLGTMTINLNALQ